MWDITYLNGPHKGMFYYLYLFSDLYDRSIVGWEVYEEESAELASELIKRITLKYRPNYQPKGFATLEEARSIHSA